MTHATRLGRCLRGGRWLDGIELALVDRAMVVVDVEGYSLVHDSAYPHFSGPSHFYTVHLHMVECRLWYCRDASRRGGGSSSGFQWVIGLTQSSEYASFGTSGNDFTSYVAPVEASAVDPLALYADGARWWKANGGSPLVDALQLPPSRLSAVDHFEARVGQHAGDAPAGGHSSLSWLLVEYHESVAAETAASVELTLMDCDVTTCAAGYHWHNGTGSLTHCPASPIECRRCPGGLSAPPGFRGCYWNAPVIALHVSGQAMANNRSGVYERATGRHGGLPYYYGGSSDAYGGFVLRTDAFNGWVLTYRANLDDGSGYQGDLKMPTECSCLAETMRYPRHGFGVPAPQLIAAAPCDECSPRSRWCENDGTTCFDVVIEEMPQEPPSAADLPDAEEPLCACGNHSVAGTVHYCHSSRTSGAVTPRTCPMVDAITPSPPPVPSPLPPSPSLHPPSPSPSPPQEGCLADVPITCAVTSAEHEAGRRCGCSYVWDETCPSPVGILKLCA